MAKQSRIPIILEMVQEDPRVVAYINEAQLRLLNKAKDGWWDTFARMRFCVGASGCITWPRKVANIRGVALCQYSTPMQNQWFEFLLDGAGMADYCNCNYGPTLLDRGYAPTFDDILPKNVNGTPVNNKKVRLYLGSAEDAGKRVLIQGTDENNLPIRTKDGSNWVNGVYLTLADPYVDSSIIISSISGVQKDLTVMPVRAYELDPDTGDMRALAVWDWDEIAPSYRRSYLKNFCTYSTSCGCSSRTVTLMAKLAYYPARVDTDWLVLGNLAALKDMCSAIRKRECNLEAEALALERSAVRELNNELRAHGMEPAVNVSPFGSATLGKAGIGRII